MIFKKWFNENSLLVIIKIQPYSSNLAVLDKAYSENNMYIQSIEFQYRLVLKFVYINFSNINFSMKSLCIICLMELYLSY